MADEQVKAMTADIETPVFEHTAFTTPKPLRDATVAIAAIGLADHVPGACAGTRWFFDHTEGALRLSPGDAEALEPGRDVFVPGGLGDRVAPVGEGQLVEPIGR